MTRSLPLAYGAAVLALTWPLGGFLGTHLPRTTIGCDFDSLTSTWILAHISHWLTAPAASALGDANIYFPTRGALFYGPTCLAALPVFAPIYLVTGNPTLAINLVFLGGIAATAASLHYVLWRWTGSHLAGLVSGFAFLTTPWVLWEWIPGAPWFAMLWCFPLIVWLVARPPTSVGEHIALVALVALQCATDPVYVAPAVLAPLGAIALVRIARVRSRRAGLKLLCCIVAGVALFLVAHAPQLLLARREDLSGQTMWFFPPPTAQLPSDLLQPLSPMALPLVAWALALAAGMQAIRGRGAAPAASAPGRHALWWATAGFLLSLTPVVMVLGRWVWIWPLVWLEKIVPIHERLRNPIRVRVAGLFGLAMLAGLGFDVCARWLRSRATRGRLARALPSGLAMAAVMLMYLEYRTGLPPLRHPLAARYPIVAAPSLSPVLLPLLQEPGGPMLELPIAEMVIFPPAHARAMYRSMKHGRQLLNGYTSYFPSGFSERMQTAKRLPEAAALAELERETRLDVVLVHTDEMNADERERWLAVAEGVEPSRLKLWARDGSDLLFRVTPPA